jgi:glycosyltransferase involved in cell wall biosynthesis
MKVTILTQYFAPEIGAPQRRLGHLAQAFTSRGHRVSVLTAMPNYPQGKVYPGYGGLRRIEELAGARVVRTFIRPSQSAQLVPRLASYFSFVGSSVALGGWEIPACDYLITESPPLFLGLSGLALARWKGARLVFNVSDLWPESAVRVGVLRPGRMLTLASWLEAFLYRHAWLVTGQSESIVHDIEARFPGVPVRRLSNGVDTRQFQLAGPWAPSHAALHARKGCAAVYAGLHGLAQGLDQVVDAAARLDGKADLDVFLLGDGPMKQGLVQQAGAARLSNVHFLDPIPGDAMPSWLAGGDVAIVPLKTYIPGAVPSKLYEAMAAGLPAVVVATGEPADIVVRHEAGLAVAPGDVAGLARALETLATDPELRRRLGANGRRAAERFYDRNVISAAFVAHLEERLAATTPREVPRATSSRAAGP